MKKKLLNFLLVFLVLLTFSNMEIVAAPETTMVATTVIDEPIPGMDPNLEWKVSVGDVKTFTYTKTYDLYDFDEDGNPNTQRMYVETENGTEIEITIKAGSTLSCEILALDDYATIQITINGVKLDPSEGGGGGIVMKTTDNKTYWETYASQASNEYQNVSVEGNFVVYSSVEEWSDGTYEYRSKFNWRTGWLESIYNKETNSTHLLREMEISSGGYPGLTPGFEISPLYAFLIILPAYSLRKRKRK